MFDKYEHHGNMVTVRSDLKGRHAEFCLCQTPCKFFKPGAEDNCPVAQATYKNCVNHGLVTPVFECPKFEEADDE